MRTAAPQQVGQWVDCPRDCTAWPSTLKNFQPEQNKLHERTLQTKSDVGYTCVKGKSMCPLQTSGMSVGQISLVDNVTRWPLTSVVSILRVVFSQVIALEALNLMYWLFKRSTSLRHELGFRESPSNQLAPTGSDKHLVKKLNWLSEKLCWCLCRVLSNFTWAIIWVYTTTMYLRN